MNRLRYNRIHWLIQHHPPHRTNTSNQEANTETRALWIHCPSHIAQPSLLPTTFSWVKPCQTGCTIFSWTLPSKRKRRIYSWLNPRTFTVFRALSYSLVIFVIICGRQNVVIVVRIIIKKTHNNKSRLINRSLWCLCVCVCWWCWLRRLIKVYYNLPLWVKFGIIAVRKYRRVWNLRLIYWKIQYFSMGTVHI